MILLSKNKSEFHEIGEKMNCNKFKIIKILFFVSLVPVTGIILISIYYSVVSHAYYDWIECDKISHIAYGLEEFFNSIAYYGGYLTLRIPILQICVLYQIYYLIRKKKAKF